VPERTEYFVGNLFIEDMVTPIAIGKNYLVQSETDALDFFAANWFYGEGPELDGKTLWAWQIKINRVPVDRRAIPTGTVVYNAI
jgi:hypothetical protein